MLRVSRAVGMPLLVRRTSLVLASVPRSCAPCAPLPTMRHYRVSTVLLASNRVPDPVAARPSSSSSASKEERGQPEHAAQESAGPTDAVDPPNPDAGSSPNRENTASAARLRGSTVAGVIARPESALRRLFASWQQGVVASIGAVMGIGFLLYFLYTPVKEDTVHHTAVVASEALADVRLKGQAVQLSKDVVLEVLRDPKSLDAAVDVVVELLARDETKIAVSSLLQSLFEDHYTQEVTKKFVLQVVQDPWIQDQLQDITEEQVQKLLRNPEIKSSLSDFLLKSAVDSLEKPQLHYEVARAVRQSAASVFNFWWS